MNIKEIAQNIEGYLTDKDVDFLAMAAKNPTAKGVVLEIGSFKGKSTVILAHYDKVVAVDPLIQTCVTDPGGASGTSSRDEFFSNIQKAGIDHNVEFHEMRSSELAKQWHRPIRLLWIDGDHTYKGVKDDYNNFAKFIPTGGIIALHDVMLKSCDGPLNVFMEDILLSEHYGPAGICGFIGWAQKVDTIIGNQYQKEKIKLYRKLEKMQLYGNYKNNWFKKRIYTAYRSLIKHQYFKDEKAWLQKICT